ncbi:hypothetical protein BKA81DRAFT_229691 [Phyllosticta paracitricarpa]
MFIRPAAGPFGTAERVCDVDCQRIGLRTASAEARRAGRICDLVDVRQGQPGLVRLRPGQGRRHGRWQESFRGEGLGTIVSTCSSRRLGCWSGGRAGAPIVVARQRGGRLGRSGAVVSTTRLRLRLAAGARSAMYVLLASCGAPWGKALRSERAALVFELCQARLTTRTR